MGQYATMTITITLQALLICALNGISQRYQ